MDGSLHIVKHTGMWQHSVNCYLWIKNWKYILISYSWSLIKNTEQPLSSFLDLQLKAIRKKKVKIHGTEVKRRESAVTYFGHIATYLNSSYGIGEMFCLLHRNDTIAFIESEIYHTRRCISCLFATLGLFHQRPEESLCKFWWRGLIHCGVALDLSGAFQTTSATLVQSTFEKIPALSTTTPEILGWPNMKQR